MSINDVISKWISCIIDKEELIKKMNSWKKLRIKFWIDPTGKTIHIWHAVPLLKLKAFQDLWHQIVFIIWDSTAQVGDTSDKDAERPMLSRNETMNNAQDYLTSISKILDVSKIEMHYNSEWMDKVSFNTVWDLCKNFSVNEMLARDNFKKRFKEGKRISLQEFLYPIMQWLDSVKVNADVEIGWNDQYFNLMAGRTLQEAQWMEKQIVMTTNLIEWTDWRKMSKTYKNFVSINDAPNDMFMKIMDIDDSLILKYFEHCTPLSMDIVSSIKDRLAQGENPKLVKMELAENIVSLYHWKDLADIAKDYFNTVCWKKELPSEDLMNVVSIKWATHEIWKLLKDIWIFKTNWDIRNSIKGWSIKIDWVVINDINEVINIWNWVILQSGKKIILKIIN